MPEKPGTLLFGATSATGILVTRSLLASGLPVAVVMRSEARSLEFEKLGAQVFIGDALQPDSLPHIVESCLDNYPILLNLIGGNPFAAPSTWPDYTGVANITDAAAAAGYRRYILVTSVGTGQSWQYVPESSAYIKPIIELKSRAEAHLKASGLNWTIIKPGGLGPPNQKFAHRQPLVTENHGVRGLINRHDLADIIVRTINADPALVRHRELYAVAERIEHLDGPATAFIFP